MALTLTDAHQSAVRTCPGTVVAPLYDEVHVVGRQRVVGRVVCLAAHRAIRVGGYLAAAVTVVVQPYVIFVGNDVALVGGLMGHVAVPVYEAVVVQVVAAVELATQPHPQVAVAPVPDVLHRLVGQQVGPSLLLNALVAVAVVAVQAVGGSHPEKTVLVLRHTTHLMRTHDVVERQVVGEILCLYT